MGRYYTYTGHEAHLFNLAVAEAIEKYDLARFVFGGEDLCSSVGPICSPSTLQRYYFPALQHAVEPLMDHGIGIVWHCSGNVLPILDDLTRAGVVGFHGFPEDGGLTLEEMASACTAEGHKSILWGSVSTSTTLPYGSVEDVKADVERCFDLASPGGGFVLAASDAIVAETPMENILALFEHGREYGRRILA